MGKALLVPFKTEIRNLGELIIEAKRLWEAEGGLADRICGTWGAVGLLVNPESSLPVEIIDGWKSFYRGQDKDRKPSFKPIDDEPSSLSDDGMLMLQWIKNIKNNKPVKFDFVLATATLPEKEYPTPKTIAQACLDNNYTEYFDKNQKDGIATFQDDDISKLLYPKK